MAGAIPLSISIGGITKGPFEKWTMIPYSIEVDPRRVPPPSSRSLLTDQEGIKSPQRRNWFSTNNLPAIYSASLIQTYTFWELEGGPVIQRLLDQTAVVLCAVDEAIERNITMRWRIVNANSCGVVEWNAKSVWYWRGRRPACKSTTPRDLTYPPHQSKLDHHLNQSKCPHKLYHVLIDDLLHLNLYMLQNFLYLLLMHWYMTTTITATDNGSANISQEILKFRWTSKSHLSFWVLGSSWRSFRSLYYKFVTSRWTKGFWAISSIQKPPTLEQKDIVLIKSTKTPHRRHVIARKGTTDGWRLATFIVSAFLWSCRQKNYSFI